MYKGRTIKFLCCNKFATLSFSKGNFAGVAKFERVFRYLICIFYAVEVLFTFIDLILSSENRKQSTQSTKVQSELENFGLDVIQILLSLITIYMLTVYRRFQDKVVKRDDPFSNANLLGLIIFMVVLQKYIIESLLTYLLEDADFFNQKLLVTFRQTFFAIEVLFVQIPIRHNFSLDHVES